MQASHGKPNFISGLGRFQRQGRRPGVEGKASARHLWAACRIPPARSVRPAMAFQIADRQVESIEIKKEAAN
jgi:hypothetical protein